MIIKESAVILTVSNKTTYLFIGLFLAILTVVLPMNAAAQRAADKRARHIQSAAAIERKQARETADQAAAADTTSNIAMAAPDAPYSPGGNPIIYAYNFTNDHLISFNAATPGTLISDIPLVGLDPNGTGELLEAIDFRPANGVLYAIASDGIVSRIVTIDTATGVLTQVGNTFAAAAGLFYGGDFNPVVDRIREVSDSDINRRLDPAGALTAVDTNLAYAVGDPGAGSNPNVVHTAYNNNTPTATQTTLFGIDTTRDTLVRIGSVNGTPVSPNSGQLFTVGSLGVNVTNFGGFDIQQGTDIGYAALNLNSVATLFQINLATGAATQIGPIGVGAGERVDGLSIAFSNTAAAADLSITKTDNVSTYTPGGTVTYTIVVSNAGADPVVGATVADTFPAGISSVTWTCTGAAGGTCNAANGTGNINTQVSLPVGGTATFTAISTIAANAAGSLTNTATVTAPAGVTDATPANNTATDTDAIFVPTANLGITKTDNVSTYTPGGTVTYTIVASNAGPDAVVGATVTDTFPAGISSVSWTCVGGAGGTCGSANGTGNINSQVTLPVGGTATFTAVSTISVNATGPLTNTASIAAPAGVTDPNPANNSATDTDAISVPTADLSITKTDGTPYYRPGTSTTYTIVVSNAGPFAVAGATVTDTLPAGISSATWTCTGNAGGICGSANGAGNINSQVTLPVGGSATFTVTANIAANATGNLTNTASVAPPAGVTDPTPANNSATDTDTIANADLAITKTDNTGFYTPGSPSTYTIVVTNNGPDPVVGATVVDNAPAFGTMVSWSCTGANGGTCSASSGFGNVNTQVSLPSGGTATFLATMNVAANATGSIANTATVNAPAGVNDANLANNTATDTNTLRPTAATVTVSGRVVVNGRGIRGALVSITDSEGVLRTVRTSSLGYYQFDEVEAGGTYIVNAMSKQYRFDSKVLQVTDSMTDVDFIGQE